MGPVERRLAPDFELYVKGRAVARLEWRDGAGWRLAPAGTVIEAAGLGASAALDEAARRLLGPPERPERGVPTGRYELHVAGIAAHALALAFPELTAMLAGDTAILGGRFDDAGLQRIVRRVGLLGGRLLALLPA